MIQITDIQKGKFCMNINGVDCVFMPMELFKADSFLPIDKKVKGSTLGWYVNRRFVSYWKIKKALCKKNNIN